MKNTTHCLDILLGLKAGEGNFIVKDCHYETASLIAIGIYEGREYKLTIEPVQSTNPTK